MTSLSDPDLESEKPCLLEHAMVLNRTPDPEAARGHLKTSQAVLYGTFFGALALVVLDAFIFKVTPHRWQEHALGWVVLVQTFFVIGGLEWAGNELKRAKAAIVDLRAPCAIFAEEFLRGVARVALVVVVYLDVAAGMLLIQGLFADNVDAPVLRWKVPGCLTVLSAAVIFNLAYDGVSYVVEDAEEAMRSGQ